MKMPEYTNDVYFCDKCYSSRNDTSLTHNTSIRKYYLNSDTKNTNSCNKSQTSSRGGKYNWCYASVNSIFLSVLLFLSVISPSVQKGPYEIDLEERDKEASQVKAQSEQTGPPDFMSYMMHFGYLPQSDMETGALRTKEEIARAITEFQKMAHLNETGEMDIATKEMMHKPRCGVPDKSQGTPVGHTHRHGHNDRPNRAKRYTFGGSTWESKEIKYRILSYTPDLTQREVDHAIAMAFKSWSDVTQLTFRREDYGHADIYIRFARGYHSDGYPFDGFGMVLAHAFFPGDDLGGDMHFDEDEHWTVGKNEGTNLFIVATHELGHSLGLAHSNVPGSLMFPWYQGYTPNFQLHPDDIQGIQSLYGWKQVPYDPYNPGSTDTPTIRPGPTMAPGATPGVTTYVPERPVTPRPTAPNDRPNACTTNLDAIALIRNEIFMFKDKWFWRIDKDGIMQGYPATIDIFWYNLPGMYGIDAVYERPGDDKIIFFIKNKYWIFEGNQMEEHFPEDGKPITDFGLPAEIEKVDAAFVWGHNQKTYFIVGNMYWRYNEVAGRMDEKYPRDMRMWGGVPTPVDAAFTYWDGATYFFKGNQFWKFNNIKMHVRRKDYPKHVGTEWLGCTEDPGLLPPTKDPSVSSAFVTKHCLFTSLLMTALGFIMKFL